MAKVGYICKVAKKKKTFKDFIKSSAIGYIAILVFFLVILCVYPGNNLFSWIAARHEIKSQERQIRSYQLEIMDMETQIKELTDNTDTLEQFARENFHFAEPGEDVFLIKE